MSVNYNSLKDLQDVLAEVFEIQDKIKDIPRDLNDKEALLQKTKMDYLEIHNKCEAIKAEVDSLWEKYNASSQERESLEKQMESTQVSRDFESLLKDIESAKNSEQIFLKSYNAKKSYLAELEENLSKKADIVEIQQQEVEEETARKDELIAEQEALLKDKVAKKDVLSKDLSKDLLFKFERIIRNKGGVGVVPVHGIICQGCHMELPQQFANDVRKDEEIHFCPYCSRVLYYEESEEDERLDNLVHGDIHTEDEEENEVANDFISSDENLFED